MFLGGKNGPEPFTAGRPLGPCLVLHSGRAFDFLEVRRPPPSFGLHKFVFSPSLKSV